MAAGVAPGFALDVPAWSASAGAAVALGFAVGAAALDDEIIQNAVESEAVVEATVNQFEEILDGFRSVLLEQFDYHVALFRFHADHG